MSIKKLDTDNMNVSELQNVLYKLIKKAKNKRLLIHIIENIEETLENTLLKHFGNVLRQNKELN